MRRTTLLFLSCMAAFLLLPDRSYAQLPLQFGVKGGINIADFTGVDYDTEPRTAGQLGISLELRFPVLPVGIETGIYYSQKGTEFSETDPQTGDEVRLTTVLDYLEIPALARLNLFSAGVIRPHLIAGPYLGLNVNAESRLTANGMTLTEDMADLVQPVELGLLVGAGSDVNIGIAVLNLQVRYGMGLTPALDEAIDDGERNSVLSVTLGYGF